MKPLTAFPAADRASVQFVLTDIDDTMTQHGQMPSRSLQALEQLKDAGMRVIPVTGRPAGWCDYFARMWPVDGIIGENGAFWFSYDRTARKMYSDFQRDEAQRANDRERLDALKETILRDVEGAGVASDQFCRVADLAIDFCEDVEPLNDADIDRIVSHFTSVGAEAKVSSIHVNGWFGSYDKLSTARQYLADRHGFDVEDENAACVFVGDSPNDQPMFRFFTHGIGVANVSRFRLDHPPRWVTHGMSAEGFAEVADALLEVR